MSETVERYLIYQNTHLPRDRFGYGCCGSFPQYFNLYHDVPWDDLQHWCIELGWQSFICRWGAFQSQLCSKSSYHMWIWDHMTTITKMYKPAPGYRHFKRLDSNRIHNRPTSRPFWLPWRSLHGTTVINTVIWKLLIQRKIKLFPLYGDSNRRTIYKTSVSKAVKQLDMNSMA